MEIKHKDINIPDKNPFENCKLEREQYADILTSIINCYSFGFVLAINNKWGTGKSTFVKMWEKKMNLEGHKTIYFNAWENDFEDDPLTALMGEMKKLTKKSNEKSFKSTLKKASVLSNKLLPSIVKGVLNKYVDIEETKDVINGVTEGVSDIFMLNVDEYVKRKKGIVDFKESLKKFIADTYEGKPLVIIVDELDRCRPNYAVSVLEKIKHFFSVPNVVFVLSIDKNQLGNAIKGVYGSDSIDANDYLKRFIDLEYSIPEPESNLFSKYLADYYKFDLFFKSIQRMTNSKLQNDYNDFLLIANLLFTNRNISLRDQVKIFSLASLSIRTFNSTNFVIPYIFLFIAFIKIYDNPFYEKIKNKKLSISDLGFYFLNLVRININNDNEHQLMVLEAYLMHYYNKYINESFYREKLIVRNSESHSYILKISCNINSKRNDEFLQLLIGLQNHSEEGRLNLGYFLNKIDLLDNLKF